MSNGPCLLSISDVFLDNSKRQGKTLYIWHVTETNTWIRMGHVWFPGCGKVWALKQICRDCRQRAWDEGPDASESAWQRVLCWHSHSHSLYPTLVATEIWSWNNVSPSSEACKTFKCTCVGQTPQHGQQTSSILSYAEDLNCVGCRDGSKPFGSQVTVCFCAVITPPTETSQSRMGAAGGGQEWGAGLKNNIFYKYFIWWHPNKFSCTPFSRLCSSDAMQHPSFIIHSSQRILSIYMFCPFVF